MGARGPAPGGRRPLSTHANLLGRPPSTSIGRRPITSWTDISERGTNLVGSGSGRLAMVRRMKKLLLLLVLIGLAGLAAKQLSSA